MGVGVQGEASGEVAQHTGDCLDVHTVLQGDGCEGMAEIVESDLRDIICYDCSGILGTGDQNEISLDCGCLMW